MSKKNAKPTTPKTQNQSPVDRPRPRVNKTPRICVDPGHGGWDTGLKGPTELLECRIALEIALALEFYLKELNCEVVLTRNTDIYIAPFIRTAICNEQKCDAFVSIHLGTATLKAAEGTATIYSNNKPESKDLAESIHKSLMLVTKSQKYGGLVACPSPNRPQLIETLAYAPVPAVQVEIDFISNPEKEIWLGESENQKAAAYSIARGISQWARSLFTEEERRTPATSAIDSWET